MTERCVTDHKPLPVAGYTKQSEAAVQYVNGNKRVEEQLLRRLDVLVETVGADVDGHWLAVARTHFEEGFMALNRSIFKPQRISLPGDEETSHGT